MWNEVKDLVEFKLVQLLKSASNARRFYDSKEFGVREVNARIHGAVLYAQATPGLIVASVGATALTATATAVNATGTPVYAWSVEAGDADAVTITTGNAAAVEFNAVAEGNVTLKCTVSDDSDRTFETYLVVAVKPA